MDWELVFTQSRVNGGEYCGDLLVAQPWDWPTQTWFQKRLAEIRAEQAGQEA